MGRSAPNRWRGIARSTAWSHWAHVPLPGVPVAVPRAPSPSTLFDATLREKRTAPPERWDVAPAIPRVPVGFPPGRSRAPPSRDGCVPRRCRAPPGTSGAPAFAAGPIAPRWASIPRPREERGFPGPLPRRQSGTPARAMAQFAHVSSTRAPARTRPRSRAGGGTLPPRRAVPAAGSGRAESVMPDGRRAGPRTRAIDGERWYDSLRIAVPTHECSIVGDRTDSPHRRPERSPALAPRESLPCEASGRWSPRSRAAERRGTASAIERRSNARLRPPGRSRDPARRRPRGARSELDSRAGSSPHGPATSAGGSRAPQGSARPGERRAQRARCRKGFIFIAENRLA